MKKLVLVLSVLFVQSFGYANEKEPRSDHGFTDTPAVQASPVDKVPQSPAPTEPSQDSQIEEPEQVEIHGPVSALPTDNLDEICVGETARQYLPCIRRAIPQAYREPSSSGRPCGTGYSLVSGSVGHTTGSLNATRWRTIPDGARASDLTGFAHGTRGTPRANGLQGCILTNILGGGGN